jgi:serine/threonine protein phosphatase PrpC
MKGNIMSTQCLNSRGPKSMVLVRAARAILGALGVAFITLPLLLVTSLPAFASPANFRGFRATSPQPPEDLARSGVSVVRIVSSFVEQTTTVSIAGHRIQIPTPTATPTVVAQCTGLGVIVASWDSTKTDDQNNWVFTDSSLLNPICTESTNASKLSLSSVDIFLSTAYSTNLTHFSLTSATPSFHCQDTTCNLGPALISFATPKTETLPYADLATTDLTQEAQVELTQSATSAVLPPANATGQQLATEVATFVTPSRMLTNPTNPPTPEAGAPAVNSTGQIVGMHLASSPISATNMSNFMNQQAELKNFATKHTNTVQKEWELGIQDYYSKNDVKDAQKAFEAATSANKQFDGATSLAQQIGQEKPSNPANNGNDQGSGSNAISSLFGKLSLISVALLGVALVLLVVLIIFMTRLFKRSSHRRDFEQDLQDAERRATAEVEAIRRQSRRRIADQPTLVPPPMTSPAPSTPPASYRPVASPVPPASPLPGAPNANNAYGAQPALEVPCPYCDYMLPRTATQCPNCHNKILTADSGPFVRVLPSSPQQYSPVPPNQFIDDQPTIPNSPTSGPAGSRSGLGKLFDAEQTLPNAGSRFDASSTQPILSRSQIEANSRLQAARQEGFIVVPRTNRGLKRKYKANEDSVFAAQGARRANGGMQEVGVFVVADGMGGHANGQDASQTAIQRIKEYIIPHLDDSRPMSLEDFRQLLMDAVKEANKAVHLRNMEQHADMGTTITAALVVNIPSSKTMPDGREITAPFTACVVNVGDSRTYLYREGEGLRKLTLDHSVVASLVAAGIIQEDDIYTHPKRNQIYRSLGEKMDVEVDSFVEPLLPNDTLLLCSDGLWDMVRDPVIEATIKNNMPDLENVGDSLIQAALKGGGEDNVSIIVVEVPQEVKMPGTPGIQVLDIPGKDVPGKDG